MKALMITLLQVLLLSVLMEKNSENRSILDEL